MKTWYDRRGTGDPLFMLHPGGVDSRALDVNAAALDDRFTVWRADRRGHGRTPDVPGPFSFGVMADDMIAFQDGHIGPAHLLGCSDGATVALTMALKRPDLVRRLVLVAGVHHHEGWLPGVLDTDEATLEWLGRGYGEVSPDGEAHYRVVAAKLAELHAREPAYGEEDLKNITARTLVMVADDDEVRLEHALSLYRALPDGELAVVPGTSHGLLVEKPDLCHQIISDFLLNDPVPTYAPIRRR
ncbi:alpha/beta fold hydrolase [Herbidospora mongoliensis]|uniref:alpha/beta fold hydrolase n=1 Tax=Herbidospora mongoliensis TaxID=688067 RepID=UPI00082EA6E5|nr:alpha/beta hydrolase [Herbidospora mongoliensis]